MLPCNLVTMTLAKRCYSSQAAFHTTARLLSTARSISAAALDGAMPVPKPTKLQSLAVERVADRAHRVARIRDDRRAEVRSA